MPIRPIEFQILLTLAGEQRHGYGIMQAVADSTDGAVQLEAGTLYRALHRKLGDGWVAECGRRPVAAGDAEGPRRKYYRLTPIGRRVATAEAERLSRLVAAARANRLLTRV